MSAEFKQLASTWAKTKLTHKFSDKYRELYLIEKGSRTGVNENAKAQSRAKTKLMNLYYKEYRELYALAVSKGCPTRYNKHLSRKKAYEPILD